MKTCRIPFALLAGDGTTAFDMGHVACSYRDARAALPAPVAALTARLVAERQQALGFELTNEPSYSLAGFRVTGEGNGACSVLHLALQQSNYFDFVSTNLSLDRPMLEGGASLRASLLRDITELGSSPLANTLSVMVLVVSQPDGVAIVPRRSAHVAFDQRCLQVSAGGAMRLAVDCDERLAPSPFVTAQREIAEELGIRVPLEAIRFLGLGVDTRTGEPELLGVAEIPLRVEDLRRAYQSARIGNDELDDAAFVAFEPGGIARLLANDTWCPGDWVCCWLALVDAFGAEVVAREVTWQTCHGVALQSPEQRAAPVEPVPASLQQRFSEWRKNWPLPLRVTYGVARRLGKPRGIWAHAEFRRWYAELQATQWWTAEQLEELQGARLRALLEHAYANVPYYRRVFDERRLVPGDITSLDALQLLPILTKDDVRRNLRELVARNIDPSRLYFFMTGGTTGTPLGFYHERDVTTPHEDAFMYRQWSWLGYRFGDRIAYLRAFNLRHRDRDGKPAWWDYNAVENSLVLSIFEVNQARLPLYIQKLRDFRPRFIQGYPSVLEIVARFALEQGIDSIRPQGIFTEFENLYPAQRALIEQAFGCPVLGGYGHSERAVDAVECPQRQGYHVSMEYGIVELTDQNGERVPEGEQGFVTGTGLDTHCMPFIRYQTDDVARLSADPCPCGRKMPMLQDIVGRWQHEVIVTADDRVIPITAMNVHSDAFANVEQYQFLQERKGELVIRVVRGARYAEADTQRILAALHAKFRGGIDLRVVFVPEIPRTQRGKYRLLDQKLDVGAAEPGRVLVHP